MEYHIKKNEGIELDLSEQHLINCAGFGPFDGMDYIRDNGIVEEKALPYNGNVLSCIRFCCTKYRIENYNFIAINKLSKEIGMDTIKTTLLNHGVVLSHMDGLSSLSNYTSGIYLPSDDEKATVGHIILIVGWKDDSKLKTGGYWICKNSYGKNWGENGYFNIAYGKANIANSYVIYLK